jgi:hypothetical protein
MRCILWWGILLLAGALVVVMLIALTQTTMGVGVCDVEMTFIVRDADTGERIPKAIVLLIEDGAPVRPMKLLTDERGTATLLREGIMCSTVSGPLRETKTSYNLWRYLAAASAARYAPLDYIELNSIPFDNKGFSEERSFVRLEFTLRLVRAKAR